MGSYLQSNEYKCFLCLVVLFVFGAAAQERPSSIPIGKKVTRAEFASAYQRFESTLLNTSMNDSMTVRINKEFDALSIMFLTRRYEEAIKRLHGLTESMNPRAAQIQAPTPAALEKRFVSFRNKAEMNRADLETIKADTPELLQALEAVKARNRLLSDSLNLENTAQILANPEVLSAQIETEIAVLKKGSNPFKNRTGDYWRVMMSEGRAIPLRVFMPTGTSASQLLPLVVAFHGAGGDENMFMDGYGMGMIKQLADQHGFLLVSPFTNAFTGTRGQAAFNLLLEIMKDDYQIDTNRIYVLGHSMGGMTTNALLAAQNGKITAAACICGFTGFAQDVHGIPPVLVVAAELDPLISPGRIEPLVKKAQAAGLPVEYKVVKNYGHTLSVSKVLPEVIAWLISKKRTETK